MSYAQDVTMARQEGQFIGHDMEEKIDELLDLVKQTSLDSQNGHYRMETRMLAKWLQIQEKTLDICAIREYKLATGPINVCTGYDVSSPEAVETIRDNLRTKLSRYEKFAAFAAQVKEYHNKGVNKLKGSTGRPATPSRGLPTPPPSSHSGPDDANHANVDGDSGVRWGSSLDPSHMFGSSNGENGYDPRYPLKGNKRQGRDFSAFQKDAVARMQDSGVNSDESGLNQAGAAGPSGQSPHWLYETDVLD